MNLLEVKGLTKHYPTFSLEDVTFSLEPGYIMGFIGKNGAGKTTSMKLIYRILSKEKGDVFFQGENMDALDEMKMKEEISLLLGGQNFYPLSTLKKIKEVTKSFYSHFDEEMYQKLSTQFELDENKKFNELSNGMKTKFQLALCLSHNAKLLLLDEPTSGLDPYSRQEILRLFQKYIEDGNHSILFSTQIVSDLESVADYITYIKKGKIVKTADKESFLAAYILVKGSLEELQEVDTSLFIGLQKNKFSFTALIHSEDSHSFDGLLMEQPNLEEIMYLMEGGIEE